MGDQELKKEKRERKREKKEKKEKKEKVSEPQEQDVDLPEDQAAQPSSAELDSEIEIDLNQLVPLSKKQQRLLKKGKLDVEKLNKKHPAPKPISEEGESKPARSGFGVWIGNLHYDTSKEEITRFIVARTANFGQDDDELVRVTETDISRVNLPKKANKSKGFAYVDLPSVKHVKSVVSLSEQDLSGRNVLIKDASSFEGRPEASASKNPPSRILFVGNLSFDTTEDNLEEHFRHCGEIVRIRMATFEDSGKCKGFAFVDFKDELGPTAALKSKLAKKLINRPLRMEYGEDRSKRNPRKQAPGDGEGTVVKEREEAPQVPQRQENIEPRPQRRRFEERERPAKRQKSSVALATAQRASVAIVPSQGKKITFD